MALQDLDEPRLFGPDWVVLRTRLTGICGSDSKQALLDFDAESADNPMSVFISFPQVLGHEVVATVDEAGPDAGLEPGQRVVLNPWLSCGPRGIDPPCPACQAGDYSLCWSFNDGRLTPGIHSGNSSDATGGFAEKLPAHRMMAIPVPDDVRDEVAVLADPFAVSLHAVTRNPPPPGGGPSSTAPGPSAPPPGRSWRRCTRRSRSASSPASPSRPPWPSGAGRRSSPPSPAPSSWRRWPTGRAGCCATPGRVCR